MAAHEWEYTILQMAAGRSSHMSERVNDLCTEGFEPVLMTGDATVTLLMRRPKKAEGQSAAPTGE